MSYKIERKQLMVVLEKAHIDLADSALTIEELEQGINAFLQGLELLESQPAFETDLYGNFNLTSELRADLPDEFSNTAPIRDYRTGQIVQKTQTTEDTIE